jgi:ribose transport system substrate-binding protein
LNLLDDVRNADGIFCPNESTTIGMLNVLEQNHLTGKVHFVGFDATPPLVAALKAGEIDALVSQNPIKMGYQGVKTCLEAIKGSPEQPIQDSGVQLINRDNLNSPEVQKLLSGG